jgi:hypothetical protein
MRMTRPMKQQDAPQPPPSACPDATHAYLAQQLALSRRQCAYLHRELANALTQAPMAPLDASTEEHLRLEVDNLRQRYATLKLHYEDAQNKIAWQQHALAFAHKVLGWEQRSESLLGAETHVIEVVLMQLLTLAHPDKWSHGQPATELAHELAVAINVQRATLS